VKSGLYLLLRQFKQIRVSICGACGFVMMGDIHCRTYFLLFACSWHLFTAVCLQLALFTAVCLQLAVTAVCLQLAVTAVCLRLAFIYCCLLAVTIYLLLFASGKHLFIAVCLRVAFTYCACS